MKILLFFLAALSVLLGVTIGGMWLWITAASLWKSGDLWVSLIALPFVCFGAIAVIVGIRYLLHQDTPNAKGIAGMTGFMVWAVLNTGTASRWMDRKFDALCWVLFLGPILCGILVYRILFRFIQKSQGEEQNKADQGTA